LILLVRTRGELFVPIRYPAACKMYRLSRHLSNDVSINDATIELNSMLA